MRTDLLLVDLLTSWAIIIPFDRLLPRAEDLLLRLGSTGTTVLEESAVCACLNSSAEENHCAHCFRIHSGASSSYCSEACLNNALGTHQSLLNKCDLSVFDGTTRRFPKLIAQLVSKSMSPQSEAQLDFQSFCGHFSNLGCTTNLYCWSRVGRLPKCNAMFQTSDEWRCT